jgi:hypothetical protein
MKKRGKQTKSITAKTIQPPVLIFWSVCGR